MRKSGKDNSGDKIYVKKPDGSGEFLLDEHGHLMVDHDLFNHDGLTQDGIAEAFIEFAKKEKLSFFKSSPSVEPFDQTKYDRLMDGLEAAEITFDEVCKSAQTLRLDSDYYKKEFLAIERIVKSNIDDFQQFDDLGLAVDASAFYPSIESHYGDGDLPFLRVADVNSLIDYDNCTTIPDVLIRNHPTLKTVDPGDIVLTKGGSVARVGLITKVSAVSRDLIFVNSSNLQPKDYIYLYLYFQTYFCNQLLLRSSSQSVQAHLTITLVRELVLFRASDKFKEHLLGVVTQSFKDRKASENLYVEAEGLLLSELGLNDWQPIADTIAVKRFSDSWGGCDRGDAEYYQPKFEQAEAAIKNAGFPVVKLGSLIEPIQNGFDFREFTEEGTPYIRVGDVKQGHIDIEGSAKVPITQADVNKPVDLRLGDILFTRKGSFGNSAVVTEREAHGIISSEIMLLRLKVSKFKILPNYISLFLNSKFGYLQVERRVHGVAYYSISQPDLADLTIPVLPFTLQEKIVENIIESFQLKAKSKQLLEIAKTGVEKAIEEDEEGAIDWMNQQLTNLGINQLNN